jgi:8-oxo-dGTP diphosphatase
VTVRAAGGVLWRPRDHDGRHGGPINGGIEVALVHRPRYDDWSLPKGKLRRGEHPLMAAGREVLEETGVRPAIGPRLPSTSYRVHLAGELVDKTVDYWAMNAVAEGGFAANSEVDGVSWLDVEHAIGRLTYDHDRPVVARLAGVPVVTATVVLVRHATAGKRSAWSGPDEERPLDEVGRDRARALAGLLVWFNPQRFVSAAPRRCVQTVAPAATRVGRPVDVEPDFNESADPADAAARRRALAADGVSTVVCSQGGLIPGLLAALTGAAEPALRTPKGEGWVISFHGTDPVQHDRLP